MNFDLQEWSELFGIGAIVTAAAIAVVKFSIINPLVSKIDELNGNFKELNQSLGGIRSDFKKLEDRVDSHDVRLISHDEQLKTLFRRDN